MLVYLKRIKDLCLNSSVQSLACLPVLLLAVACGDSGLSRVEVEEIVRAELAGVPAPPPAEPGITTADVEEAIGVAMSGMSQPEPGLSRAEVEQLVQASLTSQPRPPAGVTAAEVDAAIAQAVAAIPPPEPGLTLEEAEEVARGVVADIPARSDPSGYNPVRRRQRHPALRDLRSRSHPGPLQPGPERGRPVVRVHHRRPEPGSSLTPTPGGWVST